MTGKYDKKHNYYEFKERVPCPYCPETFKSNVRLCQHVLSKHNWNKSFVVPIIGDTTALLSADGKA